MRNTVFPYITELVPELLQPGVACNGRLVVLIKRCSRRQF